MSDDKKHGQEHEGHGGHDDDTPPHGIPPVIPPPAPYTPPPASPPASGAPRSAYGGRFVVQTVSPGGKRAAYLRGLDETAPSGFDAISVSIDEARAAAMGLDAGQEFYIDFTKAT